MLAIYFNLLDPLLNHLGTKFEKDDRLDIWVVYKEVLDDHKIFRDCWDTILGDLKQQAPPPTSGTAAHFEDYASLMTGLWGMVQFDGAKFKVQGKNLVVNIMATLSNFQVDTRKCKALF